MLYRTQVVSSYNYFSHIRTLLFPSQSITLRKKISFEEYNRAVVLIGEELHQIHNELNRLIYISKQTKSKQLDSKINKLHVRVQNMDSFHLHFRLNEFFNTYRESKASFDTLIQFCATNQLELKLWRSTFTKRYYTEKVYKKRW